jgi:hypothetical protein
VSAAAQPAQPVAGAPAVRPLHDFFAYTFDTMLTRSAPTAAVQCTIDNDSDFRWYQITASAYQAGSNSFPMFAVYLEDSSRGIPLMGPFAVQINGPNFASVNGFMGIPSVPGTAAVIGAGWGFWLPRPYRIPGGSTLNAIITATITGYGAVNISIQIALLGYKVPIQ